MNKASAISKISAISIMASMIYLSAGCAPTVEDFAKMTAGQRADKICRQDSQSGQYASQIRKDLSSKSAIQANISDLEKALRSGYWVEKTCESVQQKTGTIERCVDEGDKIVCREEDQYETKVECETIRTAVNQALETKRLAGYESDVSALDAKIVSLEKKRKTAYDTCSAKVFEMSPEEAFQMLQ